MAWGPESQKVPPQAWAGCGAATHARARAIAPPTTPLRKERSMSRPTPRVWTRRGERKGSPGSTSMGTRITGRPGQLQTGAGALGRDVDVAVRGGGGAEDP